MSLAVLHRPTRLSRKNLREKLRRRAARLLRSLRLTEADLTVLLCDDAFIAELNRQWREIDGPTDVLSFPQVAPEEIREVLAGKSPVPPLLGDIVISVETVARRAPESEFEEIERLLIHGLAHLLGHDHHSDAEAARMEGFERDLAGRLGPAALAYLEKSL